MIVPKRSRSAKINIRRVYDLAEPVECRYGIEWYAAAHDRALKLSERYALPVELVAHVIAALSPNNTWERNLLDADRLINELLDLPIPIQSLRGTGYCTYGKNVDKARRIVLAYSEGRQWDNILKGRKVTAFAFNIAYPYSADGRVTVDVHAYSIAAGRRYTVSSVPKFGKRKYEAIAKAYRAVAHEVGLLPHELQATVWVCWKRLHAV